MTGLATFLSIHCAFLLYHPPIITITLGLCATIFLAKGFLFCESIEEESYEYLEVGEVGEVGSASLFTLSFPRRRTFTVRLRTVAFWLAVILAGLIVVFRASFRVLHLHWWGREIAVAAIECGRWFIICFLVFLFLFGLIVAFEAALRFPFPRHHPSNIGSGSTTLPKSYTLPTCN